ncbi:MAG: EamA family transporter [Arcobacter sp.]|nr:MAG: EamA family transporter [Arcobacter sp.]
MINTQRVYILLVLCVLFWSGNFILGRFVNTQIEPIELAFFRWGFVVAFSIPILFFIDIKKVLKIVKENFLFLSFLSFLGITLFNTVLYIALQTTTATNALLINSIIPILILILSFFILKSNITKRQTFGIILSTIGVVFLVLKGDFLNILNISFTKGDLWVIVSSIVWATYSVIVKFKPKNLSHIELFLVIVYLGFIFLIPWYLIQGYSLEHEIQVLEENWYFFLYVSLFASILSFYFWHMGIDTISAEKTGQFTHLMPIFGSILAFIFLGEKLQSYHIIGAILIGIGIYLSLFMKKIKSN